jgi:hypothetical protein
LQYCEALPLVLQSFFENCIGIGIATTFHSTVNNPDYG